MSEDSSNSQAPRELRVPQDRETGVQEIAAGHFRLRYLYARSSDCRQSDDPGQDYVALRQDGRRLAFALCDGVSQSFYGDLAARFLGDALVEWLWRHLPPGEFRRAPIRQPLHERLLALTEEATEKVRQAPIPEDAPSLLRDALEQKRAIGSEATFVCGVVEMPGPNLPQGRVVLAWLGDAELQLWGQERDRTQELGAEWIEARRWSTKVGPKGGPIGVFVGPIEDVQRVLAYSDGIGSLRERLGRGIDDSDLAREVDRLGQMPTSDDVSFLEIEILPEPAAAPIPVTVPASVVPPPPPETPPAIPPRPPVEAPPPPSPRARPWLVYAGAVAAFAALCLVVSLAGAPLLKRMVNLFESPQRTPTLKSPLPTPTLTATPTVSPTLTSSPTATTTPVASPTVTPGLTTVPAPVATTTPVTEPDTKGVYQLPEFPPRIIPPEGEEKLPVMVVVGGERPVHVEEEVYKLRVARQDKPGSSVQFSGQELPQGISLNQVQWVWLVYQRPQPPASPETIFPSLATLLLEEERELLWWPTELQEGQEAWVFGMNTLAGLGHFILSDNHLGELGKAVRVRGIWHREGENWSIEIIEWRHFDPDQNMYVPVE